ncbi:MAG: hypothetical protein ACKOKF_12255 [Bacteroidota bacterium]
MKKSRLKFKRDSLSRAPFVRRDEEEMKKIISEIQSGITSIREACFKYGLCRNTLKLWISKLSISNLEPYMHKKHFKSTPEASDSVALQRRLHELTRALHQAKLKISSLETMIEISEEEYQIKIRKKFGAKRSKE